MMLTDDTANCEHQEGYSATNVDSTQEATDEVAARLKAIEMVCDRFNYLGREEPLVLGFSSAYRFQLNITSTVRVGFGGPVSLRSPFVFLLHLAYSSSKLPLICTASDSLCPFHPQFVMRRRLGTVSAEWRDPLAVAGEQFVDRLIRLMYALSYHKNFLYPDHGYVANTEAMKWYGQHPEPTDYPDVDVVAYQKHKSTCDLPPSICKREEPALPNTEGGCEPAKGCRSLEIKVLKEAFKAVKYEKNCWPKDWKSEVVLTAETRQNLKTTAACGGFCVCLFKGLAYPPKEQMRGWVADLVPGETVKVFNHDTLRGSALAAFEAAGSVGGTYLGWCLIYSHDLDRELLRAFHRENMGSMHFFMTYDANLQAMQFGRGMRPCLYEVREDRCDPPQKKSRFW